MTLRSAHDPLAGHGIYQALASGWHGARAIIASSDGDSGAFARYQAWADANRETYRNDYTDYYRRVARWPDSRFWRRRHQPITTEKRQNAMSVAVKVETPTVPARM